jgi:putative membrane protein
MDKEMACGAQSGSLWKSMAAGAVGGLVASLAMNRFQAAVSAVSESVARKERERKGLPEPFKDEESGGDDATVKAAEAISEEVFSHELAEDEKIWAGPLVHYGLGMALGAFYGACASAMPVNSRAGMGFGAAVWLGADEIAVPLAGLSGPPTETRLSGHVNALASHLVYGLVTHFTRKLVLS